MIKSSDYTFHYAQPSEYRFSLDSVQLAKNVAEIYRTSSDLGKLQVLDLCAGCGVIGLELYFYLRELTQIDFLEVQDVYRPYFEENLKNIAPEKPEFKFLPINYNELLTDTFKHRYDLIVCNPPYFFKDEGLLSPNEFKNRCRFFLDSDFQTLITGVHNALKIDRKAYVLMRSGNEHGRDLLAESQKILKANNLESSLKIIGDVRGTSIVEMRKHT